MAEKRRYTVTIPDHVASRIEANAKLVSSSPTEYVADVVRWWFGQGCPPVTPDEQRLRGLIDVWNLDPAASYLLEKDELVKSLMGRLGVPNLFAPMVEHDECHAFVAFDNHPTHWIVLNLWKGASDANRNGLVFEAYPKASLGRDEMLAKMQLRAAEIEAPRPVQFSQLPEPSIESLGLRRPHAGKVPAQ